MTTDATSDRSPLTLSGRLVFLFAALGPLGNLIPLPAVPASFRFYYLLLIPGSLLFLYRGISQRTFRSVLILSPVLIYMTISSLWFYIDHGNAFEGGEEGNPLFRLALLISLLLFTMFAADHARSFSTERQLRLILCFLKGYLVSLLIGYIFFIGFYAKVFSYQMLTHFEILVQMGFGILRFSPGSYPNEYGIVSSFALALLTLLLLHRKELGTMDTRLFRFGSRAFLAACYGLTLGALFLATTRAAYIAYVLSVIYIMFSQGGLQRALRFGLRIVALSLLLLACVEPFFNVIGIFIGGYNAFFDPNRPANGRFDAWNIAYALFINHPLWGAGFSSVDMMHNVYLQLLFGLGILGFSLLCGTTLLLWSRAGNRVHLPSTPLLEAPYEKLLRRTRTLALLHVLWFAFSNHNLNHFLTWFAVLIALMVNTGRTADKQLLVNQPHYM